MSDLCGCLLPSPCFLIFLFPTSALWAVPSSFLQSSPRLSAEASDSGYTSSETGDCYDYEEPPPPEFTTSESDGSNSEYGSPSDFLDEGGDDSESSDSDEQEQEALKKQYSAQLMALRNRGYKSTWRNLTLLVREGGDAERVAAILEAENQRELQLEREYRLQQLRTQSGYLYRRTAKYGLKKWRPYFFVLEGEVEWNQSRSFFCFSPASCHCVCRCGVSCY